MHKCKIDELNSHHCTNTSTILMAESSLPQMATVRVCQHYNISPDSTVPSLLPHEKLEDLDYLRNFRCKHGQLAGFGVMSTWLLPMIENLRCWNNIHYGNKGLSPYSIDVCWTNDIVPSKIKSNLNSHCQLTCDDWGTPNTKLQYCQCASTALLCYQSKQTFYCV